MSHEHNIEQGYKKKQGWSLMEIQEEEIAKKWEKKKYDNDPYEGLREDYQEGPFEKFMQANHDMLECFEDFSVE